MERTFSVCISIVLLALLYSACTPKVQGSQRKMLAIEGPSSMGIWFECEELSNNLRVFRADNNRQPSSFQELNDYFQKKLDIEPSKYRYTGSIASTHSDKAPRVMSSIKKADGYTTEHLKIYYKDGSHCFFDLTDNWYIGKCTKQDEKQKDVYKEFVCSEILEEK